MADQVAETAQFEGGVVVGVDGSESSVHALHCAATEASCHGWTLHVLRAWSMRTVPRPADCPPGAVPTLVEYEQEAKRRTEEFVRAQLGEQPDFPIKVHVVHGPPDQALIDASNHADMLVVGHRGRGGVAGLLLGEVAEDCVRKASCPVLVVRPHTAPNTAPTREPVDEATAEPAEEATAERAGDATADRAGAAD